jgi:hypothetical protein
MSTVVIHNPFPGKNLSPITANVDQLPHPWADGSVRVTVGGHATHPEVGITFDMSADEALKLAGAIVEAAGMKAVFTF